MLSRDLNYIVDVVMWQKFGNSSIFMKEVIITSILWGFEQEDFFEGCSLRGANSTFTQSNSVRAKFVIF